MSHSLEIGQEEDRAEFRKRIMETEETVKPKKKKDVKAVKGEFGLPAIASDSADTGKPGPEEASKVLSRTASKKIAKVAATAAEFVIKLSASVAAAQSPELNDYIPAFQLKKAEALAAKAEQDSTLLQGWNEEQSAPPRVLKQKLAEISEASEENDSFLEKLENMVKDANEEVAANVAQASG